MAEFKELIKCLCTEEMVEQKTARIVKVKGKLGYLFSYDAELGFGFLSAVVGIGSSSEFELDPEEIEIQGKKDAHQEYLDMLEEIAQERAESIYQFVESGLEPKGIVIKEIKQGILEDLESINIKKLITEELKRYLENLKKENG